MISDRELVEQAFAARKLAYTPYSNFKVGAALLGKSGSVYLGCNIENAAYTPTNCAERTAFFKAVSGGELSFVKIAVVGAPADSESFDYCAPCGVCRQVMMEFCDPGCFEILLAKNAGDIKRFKLEELLPLGFSKKDME